MVRACCLRLAAVLVLGVVLAACAKPTPYKPADNGTGYTEQKLEANRYRVTFSGNSVTDRETVDNYLLYRAAELTLETGHDYFEMVSKETDTATTYHTTGPDVGIYGGRGIFGWGWGFGTTFGTATPIRSYSVSGVILLQEGKEPEAKANVYDARGVVEALGETIQRPKPDSGL